MEKSITVFCDGGARGNPGPAASGFAVVEGDNIIYKESKYLGETTNNVAEYKAVIMALDWLHKEKFSAGKIVFNLDSQLITKQLMGEFKIKSERLKPLVTIAKDLEKKIDQRIEYVWNPRSQNEIADTLVNDELDKHHKKNFTLQDT